MHRANLIAYGASKYLKEDYHNKGILACTTDLEIESDVDNFL